MELPNPDVEDGDVLLDVIPNLVVVYDLGCRRNAGRSSSR